jgi:cardiolipin synthase
MRLEGDAVKSIETRFIMDWNYKATIRKQYGQLISPSKRYLPHTQRDGRGAVMQIVSSGPDTEWSSVYFGYAKMITEANKNIYIQSPYFVPDENIFESLRIAALSGIDVRIVIPGKPDHPFVYWAALSYMGELLKAGVKCYTYQKGFLHTKVIMIDGAVSTVGTANMDVRSFKLNLEINAFIFDRKVTGELEAQFMKDLENSRQITQEEYDNRPKRTRIKESFSRLLSPLL